MVLLDLGALVAPGWFPLLLVVLIGLVVVALYFNMRKHLRKIDVPVDKVRPSTGRFADPEE